MVGTRRTPSAEPVSRPTRKPPSPVRPRRRASTTPPPAATTTSTAAARRTRINRNRGPVAVQPTREEPAPPPSRKRARSPTSSAQNRSAPQTRDTINDGRPTNVKRVRHGSNTERSSGGPSTSWLTPVREELESSRHSSQPLDTETLTGTQLEAEPLDPEAMLEEMPFLERRTNDLLNLLVLTADDFNTLRLQLQMPDSKESKSLHRYEKGFTNSKSCFGEKDVLLPKAINNALGTTEHEQTIVRANMAILAIFLATSNGLDGGQKSFEDYKNLERNFPGYLGVTVTDKNFDLMLDFRTEAVLCGLSANRDNPSLTVEFFIDYFFYEHTDSQNGQSQHSSHLRLWPNLKFAGWEAQTKRRIKELRKAFRKDQEEGFLDMCAKYPWETVSEKLILYLRDLIQSPRRVSALKSPLLPAPASSSRNVAAASQASLALQTATGSDGAPELPQAPHNAAAQKTFKDKNAFASLKKNNRRSQTSNPDPAPLSPPPEAANLVSEPPEGYAPSGPEPPVAEVMDMLERSRRLSNKENVPQKRRFVDPQVGAERLSFDSQEAPTSGQGQEAKRRSSAPQQHGESSRAGASRPAELQASPEQTAEIHRRPPRPTIQSVTDDEDEYAADNRETDQDRVQQSRAQAGAPRTSNSTRPSDSTNRTRPSDSTNRTRPSNASSRPRPSDEHFEYRHNSPGSDDENDRPPSTAAEVLREKIKDQGRRQRIGHRYDREEYTPAEEDALIEDIGAFGNHWALIKQRGNPLNRERSNVQLKDKAISLKVQYLKSHTPLPAGFWKFHVRKRDHDQLLQDYGVDTYEVDQAQMEAELGPEEHEPLQEDSE